MKKSLLVMVAGILAAFPHESFGQSSLWVSGGPTYAFGPTSVGVGTGYNAQVAKNFGHWGPAVFRVDALYMQRPYLNSTDRTDAVTASVLLRHSIGPIAPYALVGTGLYGDNSWTMYAPGINAGVGVEATVAHTRVFAESSVHQYLRDARLSRSAGRTVTLVPISFGFRF